TLFRSRSAAARLTRAVSTAMRAFSTWSLRLASSITRTAWPSSTLPPSRTSTRATWPLTPAATWASRAGSIVTAAVRVAVTAPVAATTVLAWRGSASWASAAPVSRARAAATTARAAEAAASEDRPAAGSRARPSPRRLAFEGCQAEVVHRRRLEAQEGEQVLVAGGLELEPALPGLELRLVELEARDQAAGQAPLLERQALLRGG